MKGWGYLGFTLGGLTGVLLLLLLLAAIRPPAAPAAAPPPNTIAPDVTIFLAEQSVSRLASALLESPTVVDFEPNGQMQVTTRTSLQGVEPVVRTQLLLELQGTELVSRLLWVRLGFLTVPANWLPPEALEVATAVGRSIEEQIPPDFTLVGVSTDSNGVSFQLKWIGR